MTFKNLLVFSDESADSRFRLSAAASMAERFDAHLTAVAVTSYPAYDITYQAVASSQLYFEEMEQAHRRAAAMAEEVRALLVAKGRAGDVRWASDTRGGISEIAAIHGYYAEIALVGQPSDDEFGQLRTAIFEGTLFESECPIILVPSMWSGEIVPKRIMIAWFPSGETARSIRDAMPLILAAQQTNVVVVDPSVDDRAFGEDPGAAIATSIARHGVNVIVDQIPREDRSIGEALRDHAKVLSADLLVMGGYGHSRLREAVLGGVTRDMIANTEIPLLISH